VYELNEWEKIIERILQLPGATLPPIDNVAPPFKAARSSSPSNGGNSADASSDDVIPRSLPAQAGEGGNSAGAPSDDVIPRSGATRDPSSPRAASHPSSSTEDSSRPLRPKRHKKSGLLPATGREFAQQVFTDVAARRAERRERTAARVAQLEKQLAPSEPEQTDSDLSENAFVVYSK
jgi:hypothetical protein